MSCFGHHHKCKCYINLGWFSEKPKWILEPFHFETRLTLRWLHHRDELQGETSNWVIRLIKHSPTFKVRRKRLAESIFYMWVVRKKENKHFVAYLSIHGCCFILLPNKNRNPSSGNHVYNIRRYVRKGIIFGILWDLSVLVFKKVPKKCPNFTSCRYEGVHHQTFDHVLAEVTSPYARSKVLAFGGLVQTC